MERLKPGTIVQNMNTGATGVVAQDIMGCCSPEEEPVVYDGVDAFVGTERDSLAISGFYDPGVADAEKCGAGQGEKTCRYLIFGEGGLRCERFSSLRNTIIGSNIVAQGVPKHLYPGCQDDIQETLEN